MPVQEPTDRVASRFTLAIVGSCQFLSATGKKEKRSGNHGSSVRTSWFAPKVIVRRKLTEE